MELDKATFGFVVTVVGMGGTIFCLWLISLLIDLMKKIFPYQASGEKGLLLRLKDFMMKRINKKIMNPRKRR